MISLRASFADGKTGTLCRPFGWSVGGLGDAKRSRARIGILLIEQRFRNELLNRLGAAAPGVRGLAFFGGGLARGFQDFSGRHIVGELVHDALGHLDGKGDDTGLGIVITVDDGGKLFDEGDSLRVGKRNSDGGLHDLAEHLIPHHFRKLHDAITLFGGSRKSVGKHAFPERKIIFIVDCIDLIEHKKRGEIAAADVLQHFHNRFKLQLRMRMAYIQNQQQHVRMRRFFQRRFKASHEMVRQVADESYSIADQCRVPAPQMPAPSFSVERCKEFVFDKGLLARERIEHRALARVGVADERDGEVLTFARFDLAAASFLHFADVGFQIGDTVADDAAIDFKLHFTRPTRTDAGPRAAAYAFQMAPHVPQARVGVLQLREFDLQLRFVRFGAGGEDVEDKFAAVEDFGVNDFFEIAQVDWGTCRGRR